MSGALLWGKLPAHGDFVARGLAPAARDELDRWLAGSLAAARAALGAVFDDVYDAAPPWRFGWRDDAGWTAGAIAASVDGVGRHYPIVLGLSGLAGAQVEPAAATIEDLLYDALGQGWDADRLVAAAALVAPPVTGATPGEGWWTLGAERFNEARLAGARPPALMTAMLTTAGEREEA